MATPNKPSRLGRGLDALLARREPPDTRNSVSSPTNDQQRATNQFKPAAEPESPTAHNAIDRVVAVEHQKHAAEIGRTIVPPGQNGLRMLPITSIAPNPFQPRKEFRPEDLADLEASLRISGLLQPITVRQSPHNDGYELIAGERRLRAATRLAWNEIPALVRETDDRMMLTLAMVENLQRADLDPIEEADGYHRLTEAFNLTQQEVADVVGKDRSTVANALRLLALPGSVRRMLQERQITVGHARALLPLGTEHAIAELAREIAEKTLSVRDVEQRVRGLRPTPAKSGRKAKNASTNAPTGAHTAETRRVEELLRKKLQTTVKLHLNAKERGEVRIAFFSNDDLERVLSLLGIDLDS